MKSDQIDEWGAHCSLATCHALDFLPFRCQYCHDLFCSDHYKPLPREGEDGHKCQEWDEQKVDARVPSCPLCGAAVSISPKTDPNIPMDAHLTNFCPVLNSSTGLARDGVTVKAKAKKPPNTCFHVRCMTKMVMPMRCSGCQHDFCAPHRFPKDHACNGSPSAQTSSSNTSGEPRRRAALAAATRAVGSAKARAISVSESSLWSPSPASGTKSVLDNAEWNRGNEASRKPRLGIGLGKTDKRARAEDESRRKALDFRAKRGLLTEREKVEYASLVAESQRSKNGDECQVS